LNSKWTFLWQHSGQQIIHGTTLLFRSFSFPATGAIPQTRREDNQLDGAYQGDWVPLFFSACSKGLTLRSKIVCRIAQPNQKTRNNIPSMASLHIAGIPA